MLIHMQNMFDPVEYMQKSSKVITFAEYAAILIEARQCSDTEDCLNKIRSFRRSLPARGLGDTVSKMTGALGIPECGGCQKRKELLNKLVPYANN